MVHVHGTTGTTTPFFEGRSPPPTSPAHSKRAFRNNGTFADVGVGHAQLPVGALTATQNDVLQADFSTQQQGGPSSSGAFPGAGQHGNWGGYNPR